MKKLLILSLILSVPGISDARQFEHVVVIVKREQKFLRGTVTDPNEGIITGATVELYTHPEVACDWNNPKNKNVRQKRLAAYFTGKDGLFNFSGLKAGNYEIRVQAKGFNTFSYCIKVRPNSSTGTKKRLEVRLTVAN